MTSKYEIRADSDRDTIVVYQAYSDAIAKPAVQNKRFVPPFSFTRMTWIKPSFLWLMHRSNWAQKKGQEKTLRVRISRRGWEKALAKAVLTHPVPAIHGSREEWAREFEQAEVHVQWDTERSLRGAALDHYSIQIGLSRHIIEEFVEQWIVDIEDLSPTVAKIRTLMRAGKEKEAKRLLPPERLYKIDEKTAKLLHP